MKLSKKQLEEGIVVVSFFDGMSCGQLALQRLGIKVKKYYAYEIDKYAIIVTQANFPNTLQMGSVTEFDISQIPEKVDLMFGGSPCQGFSYAGKGLNFEDPRSKLFFDFIKAKEILKPQFALLENVKMRQDSLDIISSYMKVDPILINSRLVSAQNRNRHYWGHNFGNITLPEDRNILWGDVRERGVSLDNFYYTEKAMQWLTRHSQSKNKLLKVHSDKEKMQMLEYSHHKKYSSQRFFGILDIPVEQEAVGRLVNRRIKNFKRCDNDTSVSRKPYIEFRYDGKTNCLSTVTKDNVVVPFTLEGRIPSEEFMFRYITPLECERLQTVPDNYTNHVSNSQRYKMLGNGWTVDVICHIFKNMLP